MFNLGFVKSITLRVLIFLSIASLLYFWDLFTFKGLERKFLTNDFNHYYNLINFVKESQSFPWWSSYRFQGLPVFAQMDLGLAYPPMILFLFVGKIFNLSAEKFFLALEFYTVLHLTIAGLGVYALSKKLGANIYGSVIAAITFMFSGIVIENINAFPLHVSFMWLPFVLYNYIEFLSTKKAKYYLWTILLMAISLLGGILQVAIMYTSMVLALYFVWYVYIEQLGKTKQLIKLSALSLAIPIFAVLLCAFQILPTYELMTQSTRSALTYDHTAWTGHFKPRNLLDFVIPHFFTSGFGEGYTNIAILYPTINYLGILPLVLMLLAIYHYKNKKLTFFMACGLLFLLLSMGGFTTLHDWIFNFVPLGDKFRNVAKYQYIFALCSALLAGYSFSKLSEKSEAGFVSFTKNILVKYTYIIVGFSFYLYYLYTYLAYIWDPIKIQEMLAISNKLNLSILFILFSAISIVFLQLIANGLKHKIFIFVIILFVFIDLAHYGKFVKQNNSSYDPENIFFEQTPLVDYLKSDTNSRVDYRGDAFIYNYLPEKFNLRNIAGYSPFILQNVSDVLQLRSKYPVEKEEYGVLSGLLSQRYLVSATTFTSPSFELVYTETVTADTAKYNYTYPSDLVGFAPRPIGANIYVYENLNYLKSPFFVNKYIVESDTKEQIAKLDELVENKTINESIILEEDPPFEIISNGVVSSNIEELATTNNNFTYKLKTDKDSLLYFAIPYYPGWKAKLNGQIVQPIKANHAYMAIPVPAGEYTLELSFYPNQLNFGIAVTIFASIILGFILKWVNRIAYE